MRLVVFCLMLTNIVSVNSFVLSDERQTPRSVSIPVPDDVHIDDATLNRLASKYQEEKHGFLQLLLTLEANQIDYSRDSLTDIDRKRKAVIASSSRAATIVTTPFYTPELRVDYVRLAWDVVPRLRPHVIAINLDERADVLQQTIKSLKPGDRVELGEGTFTLSFGGTLKPASDIEIVGVGRDKTILKLIDTSPVVHITRWRLSDLKVDFGEQNRPTRNALPGGSLCVERCTIAGSSMMAGVFGAGGHLLVDDCLLDVSKSRFGGRLFMPTNTWQAIYFRKTTVKQRHGSQSIPCPMVLDRCEFTSEHESFWHASPLFVRKTRGLRQLPDMKAFEFATDDEAVVHFALGKRKQVDARIARLASATKLHRNPFYWIGMLRHQSPEVRKKAAEKVLQLLGQEITPMVLNPPSESTAEDLQSAKAISAAIHQLKHEQYAVRQEARNSLMEIGEAAVPALRAIMDTGTPEQRRSAERILDQIVGPIEEQPVPREWELEYGRLARWYADNRSQLIWNEAKQHYESRRPAEESD